MIRGKSDHQSPGLSGVASLGVSLLWVHASGDGGGRGMVVDRQSLVLGAFQQWPRVELGARHASGAAEQEFDAR